jgi:Tfp pilus assembly protein PilN
MKANRRTAGLTALLFILALVSGSYPALAVETAPAEEETARLVKEADEAYQNGNFRLAIEKYQKAMQLIGEKKELAQTKQELFQTMTSLALTYFTIQENAKAEKQLQDLIRANPNYEMDPEYYPPKFVEIYRGVQKNFLGRLAVTTVPAGAMVYLGSTKLGRSPLAAEKILKGKYELKAELEGFTPVRREIIVQADTENTEEMTLEKLQPVIEKSPPPAPVQAKKKKKLSPLVLVGGAVLVVAAVVLLAGKKSTPAKQLKSLTFSENNPVPIDVLLPSYVPLNVSGVPARIEKIDFRVVIEHPQHMEDLNINIIGTDTHTLFNIWNRAQASEVPTVIGGSSNAFDSVAPNGTWRLMVQNQGHSAGGRILEFTLKIYFMQ